MADGNPFDQFDAGPAAPAATPAANPFDRFGERHHLLDAVRGLEQSGDTAVSPKGAIGRYQITPDTAKTYGLDPARLTDPDYAEMGADKILSDLSDKFGDDDAAILVAYNAGPGAARQWIKNGRDISKLPKETRFYLASHARQTGDNPFDVLDPSSPPSAGAAAPAAKPKRETFLEALAKPFTSAQSAQDIFDTAVGAFKVGAGSIMRGLGEMWAATPVSAPYGALPTRDAARIAAIKRDALAAPQAAWPGSGLESRGVRQMERVPAERQTWATKTAEVAAGIGPYVIGGPGAPMLMGASGYDNAMAGALLKGLSSDDPKVQMAAASNATFQTALGYIPASRILGDLAPALRKPALDFLLKSGIHVTGGAATGAAMATGENIIEQLTFDPDKPTFEGVGESAAQIAALEAVLHVGHSAASGVRERLRPREKPPAPMPETSALADYAGPEPPPDLSGIQPDVPNPFEGALGPARTVTITDMAKASAEPEPD
ncbi:MAG TPA: lytic transglycosylase domain-containing protein, partial [Caulobacteraceae bacterium]|nr:lytic transglycosylase domain-containing protein [Caulobacteraceae bacterium]